MLYNEMMAFLVTM